MNAIPSIDLVSVTGGGAPSSESLADLSTRLSKCNAILNNLIKNNQAVPKSFLASCGDLYPGVSAGARAYRNSDGVAKTSSK